MARLFISQDRLDSWTIEEKVDVTGTVLTLRDNNRSFDIEPAVHFLKVSGGGDDPHSLIGTVRGEQELGQMGAEHYMNSVIFGEVAYDVQCGFVGRPVVS